MRGYEVIVHDMWMIGCKIQLVVDTDIEIPVRIRVGDKIEKHLRKLDGIILEYDGGYNFETLKKLLKTGEKVLIGITRDFQYCTTQQEFKFCV